MKKALLISALFVCILQLNVLGETQMGGRNFGLGLGFGDYTEITGKLWVTDINAFSAGLGFGSLTRVHLDFLWHDFNVFKVEEGRLPLYYGIGGSINTINNISSYIGVRGTLGISYIFKNNNFDIFLELTPTLRLNVDTGLFLSGAIGARFFFL